METWTFFCKNGAYDGDYRAERRRFLCHGIRSAVVQGIDSGGMAKDRLTLWIPQPCGFYGDGGERIPVCPVKPGDRVTVGDCGCDDGTGWRITGVGFYPGSVTGGVTVTAE